MFRYTKILLKYMKINFKELRSYGVDFYIGSIAMFLKNISNLFLIYIIYNLVHEINGWNIYEMIYLYSLVTISFSIWRCFFINTLNITYYVKSGRFDLILTKPVNPLFLVFMEGFDEDAWGDLAVGIVLYIYVSIILKINIISIILVFIIAIVGGLVFSAVSVLGSLISIIYVGVSNFSDLPYIIFEFGKYPISIFSPILIFIFKTIIPIAWITYIPAMAVLKNNYNIYIIFFISIIISLLYFITVSVLWNICLNKYSSSGT